MTSGKIPTHIGCPWVCLSKGDEVLKSLQWTRLLFFSTFYTSGFEDFFLLHFWEKSILNKCPKFYLVLKTSKFLPSFQICLLQAFLRISLL